MNNNIYHSDFLLRNDSNNLNSPNPNDYKTQNSSEKAENRYKNLNKSNKKNNSENDNKNSSHSLIDFNNNSSSIYNIKNYSNNLQNNSSIQNKQTPFSQFQDDYGIFDIKNEIYYKNNLIISEDSSNIMDKERLFQNKNNKKPSFQMEIIAENLNSINTLASNIDENYNPNKFSKNENKKNSENTISEIENSPFLYEINDTNDMGKNETEKTENVMNIDYEVYIRNNFRNSNTFESEMQLKELKEFQAENKKLKMLNLEKSGNLFENNNMHIQENDEIINPEDGEINENFLTTPINNLNNPNFNSFSFTQSQTPNFLFSKGKIPNNTFLSGNFKENNINFFENFQNNKKNFSDFNNNNHNNFSNIKNRNEISSGKNIYGICEINKGFIDKKMRIPNSDKNENRTANDFFSDIYKNNYDKNFNERIESHQDYTNLNINFDDNRLITLKPQEFPDEYNKINYNSTKNVNIKNNIRLINDDVYNMPLQPKNKMYNSISSKNNEIFKDENIKKNYTKEKFIENNQKPLAVFFSSKNDVDSNLNDKLFYNNFTERIILNTFADNNFDINNNYVESLQSEGGDYIDEKIFNSTYKETQIKNLINSEGITKQKQIPQDNNQYNYSEKPELNNNKKVRFFLKSENFNF